MDEAKWYHGPEADLKELRFQRDYARRQFEIFKAHQALQLAKGNLEGASNWIMRLTECNDTIDRLNRKLGDV